MLTDVGHREWSNDEDVNRSNQAGCVPSKERGVAMEARLYPGNHANEEGSATSARRTSYGTYILQSDVHPTYITGQLRTHTHTRRVTVRGPYNVHSYGVMGQCRATTLQPPPVRRHTFLPSPSLPFMLSPIYPLYEQVHRQPVAQLEGRLTPANTC